MRSRIFPVLAIAILMTTCKGDDPETETVLPPTISGFTPDKGQPGTSVTISGDNFSTTVSANTVTFNGTAATVQSATRQSLTVAVPTGATSGPIAVSVGGKSVTSTASFTIIFGPEITGFTPTKGSPGTEVTITGKNFSTTPGENIVKIGSIAATVTAATTTTLKLNIPATAVTGKFEITTNGISISALQDFIVPHSITSFTPASGIAGTSVTITGERFSSTLANNVVTFGNVPAVVTQASATSLTVTAPSAGFSGKINVTISGEIATSTGNYTYVPKIDQISPNIGPVGSTITITGSGFNQTAALNIVKVGNGPVCSVTNATANTITATVVAGSVTGNVTVTSENNTATGPSFDIFTEAFADSGGQRSSGEAIAVDGNGNIFVTGSYSIQFKIQESTSTGSGIFVAKFDAQSKLLWLRGVPVTTAGNALGISTDNAGNAFIVGYTSSATFGSITVTATGVDLFVAKITGDGTFSWVKNYGGAAFTGTMDNAAYAVDTDPSGNPVITGAFVGDVSIGSFALSSTTAADKSDIVVAKFNKDNGTPLWAKNFGGADRDEGLSVSCASSGEIYVGGDLGSATATIGSANLTNAGQLDGILIKLDTDGNPLWSKSLGGTKWDLIRDVEANGTDGVIITGDYTDDANIGGTPLTSSGLLDYFVAKYASDGSTTWVKSGGSSYGADFGNDVDIKPDGSIVLAAQATGDIHMGGLTVPLGDFSHDSALVVTLDASGNATSGKIAGTPVTSSNAHTFAQAVAVGSDGTIHLTGSFRTGDGKFGSTTLHASTNSTFFLWNIRP